MGLLDNIRNGARRSLAVAKLGFEKTFRAPTFQGGLYPLFALNSVLVAVGILALSFIAGGFEHFDDDVARYAARVAAPGTAIGTFFTMITDLGTSGWILVCTGVTGLVISALPLTRVARVARAWWANLHGDLCFIFFTVAITGILANLIKNTIGRARPKHLETLGHLEFDFARFESSFASFPSGHSTTFGAICMGLFLLLPRRWWALWVVLAIIGGASRVMVGAHYPSDVLAGLLFGAGLTWLAARWLARRNVLFSFDGGMIPVRKFSVYRIAANPRSRSAIRSSASSRPT